MIYRDKKQVVKLLSYMSTFDGGLYVVNRKDRPMKTNNAMFIMNMRKENLDYVEWVASVLNSFTSCIIEERKDYNNDGYNRAEQVRIHSRRHPLLTKIRDRIYNPDNKKVIDPHMLKMIDAEALAIIFMTDGGSYLDKNKYPCVSLNTKGFSYNDNMALSKSIYDKLGIRTTVNKHNKYYFLRVKSSDVGLFVDTVRPFMKDSFLYKIERLAPLVGDDIVCTDVKASEVVRNEQPL